jgi:hypothetical protein
VPRVPWRSLRIPLQLLDHDIKFWILQPFMENCLNPINYNEREGKEGPFIFIFTGKNINKKKLFSILVNDLIIIPKQLGHPFLFL